MNRSRQFSYIALLTSFSIGLVIGPGQSFARQEEGLDAAQESEAPVLSAIAESPFLQDGWQEQFMQQLELDDAQEEKRVDSIKKRIRELKAVLRKERAAAEAIRLQVDRKAAENKLPAQPIDPPSAELNSPETAPSQNPIAAVPENAKPVEPDPIESVADPAMSANSLDKGIQVLANPVNSFELANSLFATGSYDQALKSYEALLQEEVTDYDRDWLLCLSASCYRLKGDLSKAESIYREVIASKEKSHANDYSQWFLEHLTKKKQLRDEFRLLAGELTSMAPGDSQ